MRLAAAGLVLLAAGLAACAIPKPRPPVAPTAPAVAQTPPAPKAANFELTAFEVVATQEDDGLEYVQVFVDGQLRGRTESAAKSRPKLWRGLLPEGNHPMRFEVWDVTGAGPGARRGDELQPPERFFRIEPGQKTRVTLKFFDHGRQFLLDSSRR